MINFLIGDNPILKDTLALQNSYINKLYTQKDHFSTYAIFPEDIYTYGQYIIDNNKTIYASYFSIENEKFDYRLSDEINDKDGLKNDTTNVLSNFKRDESKGVMEVLANIATVPCC
ncbi:UNVERIFIED_CONTAM: hypothetical protein O8I53_11270 [Campylobacter lari]